MASGRRDYTFGFLSEVSTGARATESFVKTFGENIATVSESTVYTYTVPTGYRLAINRIEITTSSRMRNYAYAQAGTDFLFTSYFDDNYCFTISDQNPYYIPAGTVFLIKITNLDSETYAFAGTVIGVLETL